MRIPVVKLIPFTFSQIERTELNVSQNSVLLHVLILNRIDQVYIFVLNRHIGRNQNFSLKRNRRTRMHTSNPYALVIQMHNLIRLSQSTTCP